MPFIIYDPGVEHTLKEGKFGLANVAPTVATLLGLDAARLLGREHGVIPAAGSPAAPHVS